MGRELGRSTLETLLQRADIWRGGHAPPAVALATGCAPLDAELPGGGWPLGALVEILHARSGIGELSLLMPALAALSQQGRWVAFVAPPYLPYAPALARAGVSLPHLLLLRPRAAEVLWTVEQSLRAGSCGAVLAWPERVDFRALRRLQLAAEAGNALGVLFRPAAHAADASPAALRLRLTPAGRRLRVELLKRRGGRGPRVIEVDHALAGPPSPLAAP